MAIQSLVPSCSPAAASNSSAPVNTLIADHFPHFSGRRWLAVSISAYRSRRLYATLERDGDNSTLDGGEDGYAHRTVGAAGDDLGFGHGNARRHRGQHRTTRHRA